MIPHRMLSSEICGNGLKGRVTACRKRLRVNRVAQRAQVNNDAEELFPETTPFSRFHDYAAGNGESEMLLLVGEQEVGIT